VTRLASSPGDPSPGRAAPTPGIGPAAPTAGVHPAGVHPAGALEELDGTPIVPAAPLARPAAFAWHRAAAEAARATAARPRLWAYALVAFLARGGLAVLALPIVVLPTFVGLANLVGPASVSAAGPGPRLVAIIVAAVAAIAVLVVTGTIVAAAAETALHRATVEPHPAARVLRAPGPGAGIRAGIARVAAVRLVLLVPVAAALATAVPAWVAVAYRELTLPSDVAAPLVLRILAGGPAVSALVVVTWLVAEVGGGFAARRAVLLGAPVPRALAAGLLDIARFPLGTLLTMVVALAVSLALLLPATWAVSAAWDAVRLALVDDAGAVAALATTVLLAAAWLGALLLAAVTAALRATLLTAELLRRRPAPLGPGAGAAVSRREATVTQHAGRASA
jgi:hypothetical protein